MKKIFEKIALGLAAVCSLATFGLAGCGSAGDSGQGGGNKNLPLYQIADVVKSDLLWDTKTTFATVPERKSADVSLGENIDAFYFKSEPYQGSTHTWVFAAVGVPISEMPKGGYPAIVLAHGGGGYVSTKWINYWTEQGYVAIAFDSFSGALDANGNRINNPDGGPKETGGGSNLDGVDNPKDAWIYHAVAGAMHCNSILRARKDVDSSRIVMTGNSWGGFVTCVTAGVDKRFAAFASTNGTGFVYNDTTWQKDGIFGGERKQEWVDLYDASTYLPYATKPMMFVSGVADEFFSAYNRQASADLVKGKVFYSQRTNIKHAEWTKEGEIAAFFAHVLYGQDTLSLISEVTVADGVASFTYENETFSTVKFVYTTSTDADSHKWVWESVEVTAEGGVCSYEIPDGTTAFLFETSLIPTFGQSTEIVILDKTANYQ